jgi:crotonobetainyl-CoA:carnitine CoA-transferase CaiB-like acyl-CoA transferase
MMAGILDGVRILDFTQMKTGPMGTQLLADLGADVIKVERPGGGEWERGFPAFGRFTAAGASPFFLSLNRNKRSLAIDLRSARARDAIYRLMPTVDVVVQNFRPGVLDRLGYGYEALRALRPDVVYCSSSGYGGRGPYVERPGQDLLAQALSGMVLANGTADRPMPVASTVADGATALMVAIAILGGLVHRLRTGEGQYVEVDLLSTLIALQQEEIAAILNLSPRPEFRRSESGVPAPWLSAPYGIYPTKDERYLAIAMNPLDRLAALLDLPALNAYASPEKAFSHRDEVKRLIEARTREDTQAHWVAHLLAADIWCAPVQSLAEAVDDPQVRHNELIRSLRHPVLGDVGVVATPIRYSATPPTYRLAPPLAGEHSRAVLAEAGLTAAEIEALVAAGVVTEPPVDAAGGGGGGDRPDGSARAPGARAPQSNG